MLRISFSPWTQDDIVLTIMIGGANEHAPEFASDRYDVDISEYNILASAQQHTAGEIIATVTATDADANDEIEYIITGGNEDNLFEIPNPLVCAFLPKLSVFFNMCMSLYFSLVTLF